MKPVVMGLLTVAFIMIAAIPGSADSLLPLSGSGSFYDVTYSNVNRLDVTHTGTTTYPDYNAVVNSDAGYDDRYASTYQWAHLVAFTPYPINWGSSQIDITERSNGIPVLSFSFNNPGSGNCVSQTQEALDVSVNACSSAEGSTFSYDRWAGQAGNFNSAFTRYQYTEHWNSGYDFSYSNAYQYGPLEATEYQFGQSVAAGTRYGLDIQIRDGSITYTGSDQMTLSESGWMRGYNWMCQDPSGSSDDLAVTCSEALESNFQSWGESSFGATVDPPTNEVNQVSETSTLPLLSIAAAGILFFCKRKTAL